VWLPGAALLTLWWCNRAAAQLNARMLSLLLLLLPP
jgi:hypothetical protein